MARKNPVFSEEKNKVATSGQQGSLPSSLVVVGPVGPELPLFLIPAPPPPFRDPFPLPSPLHRYRFGRWLVCFFRSLIGHPKVNWYEEIK